MEQQVKTMVITQGPKGHTINTNIDSDDDVLTLLGETAALIENPSTPWEECGGE